MVVTHSHTLHWIVQIVRSYICYTLRHILFFVDFFSCFFYFLFWLVSAISLFSMSFIQTFVAGKLYRIFQSYPYENWPIFAYPPPSYRPPTHIDSILFQLKCYFRVYNGWGVHRSYTNFIFISVWKLFQQFCIKHTQTQANHPHTKRSIPKCFTYAEQQQKNRFLPASHPTNSGFGWGWKFSLIHHILFYYW